MTPSALYRLLESGDPRALALARSLTARVQSGFASPEEAATHQALVRLHESGASSSEHDIEPATIARLRTLVARARSSGHPASLASFGRGGGGHGGGAHGGGGHGGWGHRGGGWNRGWGGGGWLPWWPVAAPTPCYWDPYYGWVCPPW